ncbi:putative zinc-binding metallopeptidase [Candidatus Omnitrophota bacterium]
MKKNINLETITDDELMEVRFCELPITLQDSPVEQWVNEFIVEIDSHSLQFKPSIYLADEWLCPEGVPVIGVPFYLVHPRLRALEKKMMLDAEGSDKGEFMRLMRHEMGHAVVYAFRLHRKKKWRDLFGHPMEEENEHYRFKKYSRNFVHNVENFYAQSHPDEDFAETFAVWLNPESQWRERYKNFPVMRKLEYVDVLMKQYRNKLPEMPTTTRYYNIKRLQKKLRTYYNEKRKIYASDYPDYYDKELLTIFSEAPDTIKMKKDQLALTFFRKYKRSIITIVARWTKERKYVVDHLVRIFIQRVKEKKFIYRYSEQDTIPQVIACITAMVKNYQVTAQFKEGE